MSNLAKLYIADNADTSAVNLPQEYLDKLELMFENVLKFFNDNDIMFWCDGGTLLGCVRDGAKIKWDDDEDLACDVKNYYKLLRLIPEFKKLYDYEVRIQVDNVIKFVDNRNIYIRDTIDDKGVKSETGPRLACIDVFLYVEKKGEYMLDSAKNRKLFKNCIYKKEDLFPLKEYDYGRLKVMGPKNPDQFLTSYYGNYKEKVVYLYL
jgi:phosphorylcholine metabolism protein LicD